MRITLDVNLTKRTLIITSQDGFVRGDGTIYSGEMTIASSCVPEVCGGTFFTRGECLNKDLREVPYGTDERLAAIVRTLAKCCEYVSIRFATT